MILRRYNQFILISELHRVVAPLRVACVGHFSWTFTSHVSIAIFIRKNK